jgi:hypothetical protein
MKEVTRMTLVISDIIPIGMLLLKIIGIWTSSILFFVKITTSNASFYIIMIKMTPILICIYLTSSF